MLAQAITVSESLADMFPSDRLLELLTSLQLANRKVTREELTDRCRDDFVWEIERAILVSIRSAIHVATHESGSRERLANYPLSCDDGDMFTTSFATRLIKTLTPIVGPIPDGKDDAILQFLYRELAHAGMLQEITDGNYIFAYKNGQYMIRLRGT